MRFRSTLPFLVLASLVLGASPAVADHGEGPDCGAPGDAGDTRAEATRITPAVFRCLGAASLGDDDWYLLALEAGGSLEFEYLASGLHGVSVYDPSGTLVAEDDFDVVPITATGDWALAIRGTDPSWEVHPSYLITVWTRELHVAGDTQASSAAAPLLPGHGVTGLRGPDGGADGFDGRWVRLDEPAHGGEHVVFHEGTGVYLYDDELRESEYRGFCSGGCRVPAGTVWILAVSQSMPVEDRGWGTPTVAVEGAYEFWLRH